MWRGGAQTLSHILRAFTLEEDSPAERATCSSPAEAWTLPSVVRCGWWEVRGAPRGRLGRRDNRSRWGGSVEETIIGRGLERFWGRSGRLFLFFLFPSSPMWKWHSARRNTGVDRTIETDTETDVLSATRSERSGKTGKLLGGGNAADCCLSDRRWRDRENGRSRSALQWWSEFDGIRAEDRDYLKARFHVGSCRISSCWD